MMYLGDYAASGKVAFLWNTNAIAGESITRATDGTLKIFKAHATAATWATERSSLAGVTQLEDFDATGIHSVYIDLSDNTDAGFYVAGAEYSVAIVGAVVDGKTVNVPLAHFSIERAGGSLAVLLARLPAALVSGRIDASVGAMAPGVLTATAIASDAITDAKVASDVTIASVTGSVGSVASGGIVAASFAANAITAAKLDPDVTTELQAGLAMEASIATLSDAVSNISTDVGTALSNIVSLGGGIADVQTQVDLIPGTQDGKTFAQLVMLMAAVLLGKASGLGTTTAVYRSVDDGEDRVTATVDTDGNRSAVTLNTA